MKKTLLLVALLLAVPASSWATAQYPDNLIYEGKTVGIYSNPLEQYFSKDHPRPMKLFDANCSAIWRGYVATWQIEKDKLYLVRIVEGTCENDAPKIPLSKIFPGKKAPIFAGWFSGTLVAPQGKELRYVHMGYQTVYEKELHISVKDGIVQGKKTIDNRKK